MKITKSELKLIIKEEALKFKKKLQLESQLAEVEKELEEVKAGDMHELPDGTMKYKPEFEELSKDGGYPALKEEESCEEGTMEEEEKTGFEGADAVTVEEDEACEEQTLEEMLAEIMSEDDEACEEGEAVEETVEEGEACEEGEAVEEGEACEESTMEEEEKTGFEGADAVTVEENDMCEVAEGAYCEEATMEEGWLSDMLGIDEKKKEARVAAKQEAEAALKAGNILAWKGKDTFRENKVVGQLTDEQRKEMVSKIEKILDHSEKSHGYQSDFFVAQIPGRDKPVLAATLAGPKTKLGQALAAIGGAAAGVKRMEESEIRRIFKEEVARNEKVKELQIQANKIISEIEKIG